MKPFTFCKLILTAVALTPLPQTAGAQEAPARTMLILDGSGSMWGQIDGTAKIGIARGAVDRMLADWPEGREIGLMSYGHRREGDCSDIEVLANPAPLDRAALGRAMETIRPRGKTPIGASVEAAADRLGDAEGSVIVVTDGLETCGADLCALGERMAQRGTPLTAHVIGFDVVDEDGQLACLADATGGRFLNAADAGSLTDALQKVSAPAEPAETLFADDFDRDALGDGWRIQAADPSRFILEDSTLMAMTAAPGYMGKTVDQPNVFQWQAAEIPAGDWEIAADFTARLGEVQSLGGRRAVIQVGRYTDPENFIAAELYRKGNNNDDLMLKLLAMSNGTKSDAALKIAGDTRGYDLSQILRDFEEKGATLSLVKKGRDYVARLATHGWTMQADGPEILQTYPVTILRTSGAPALFAGTVGEKQTMVRFDRIELRGVVSQ